MAGVWWPPGPFVCRSCYSGACECEQVTSDSFSPTLRVSLLCRACGWRCELEVTRQMALSASSLTTAIEDLLTRYGGPIPHGYVPAPPGYASGGYVQRPSTHHALMLAGALGWADDPARAPAAPPEPGPDLQRFEGSFIGYRAWRISEWQLIGTNDSGPWTPGVNEAECRSRDLSPYSPPTRHKAPAADCHCGMYALARFSDEQGWWQNADVLGAVEAWADEDEHNHDRFFIHSTGFRSQYAKIILLATSDEYPRSKNAAIRALADEHGADVCRREHLEAAASEHGQLVPDEVLEWVGEGDPYVDFHGYLGAMVQQMGSSMALSGQAILDTMKALSAPALPIRIPASTVPAGRKGICRRIGTPGPPRQGSGQLGARSLIIHSRYLGVATIRHGQRPSAPQPPSTRPAARSPLSSRALTASF